MRKTCKKIQILFIIGLIVILSLNLGSRIYIIGEENMEETTLRNPDLSYWDHNISIFVGDSAYSHYVGDANNDGYNDIVVANQVEDTVSILLWNKNSKDWDSLITKSVGQFPVSVFIGDADNDGYNDIITANLFEDSISILLWKGVSGDWNPEITKSVGQYPFDVFVGDANNDGYNDIVTANYYENTTSILLWNENSVDWDTEIKKSVGELPYSIFIGDANNDGYNEIITANSYDNTTSVLIWNESSGDWNILITKSVGIEPSSIYIGDVNNDDYNDIVTSNLYANTASILLWNESSEDWDSQFQKSVGTEPTSIYIGDANNDGYNDIATSNSGDGTVSILLWNEILGNWDPQIKRSVGYGPNSVFIEDVNNDGLNDISIVDVYGPSVSILLWRSLSPIQVTSPENKTYTSLPNGYYLSTYGFENDVNGRNPGWFQEVGTVGGSAKIIEELGGHKKILELRDTSSGFNAHVIKTLYANPEFGTIEFWMRSDFPKLCGFRLDNGLILNEMITMRIAFNILQYNNGSDWKNIRFMLNNTWYHIQVDFECTTGNYTGLSQYTWRLYVNNINYGEFNFINNQNQAHRIEWYTDYLYGLLGYSYYLDAIGFSWASNYNPGDNLNEGLLLQFDPKLQFDSLYYSFDEQIEVKILGNTVIPFPEDGLHTIQISGNTSDGGTTESELRYFSVDTKVPSIHINSPGLNEIFGAIPPKYNISITEENIVTTWYTLDGGITNITFTELTGYIDLDTWLSFNSGPILLRFYVEDIVGNIEYDEIIIVKQKLLNIEVIDQSFTKDKFEITFYIHNENGEEIDSAIIQIWWDGNDVSTSIQNLGAGLYFISLNPITVSSSEDPIKLNITIAATGYDILYFETFLTVDPKISQKNTADILPLPMVILITSMGSGAIVGTLILLWFRKKRKT